MDITHIDQLYMCVDIFKCVCICVLVCVCANIFELVCVYTCMCVRVCVRVNLTSLLPPLQLIIVGGATHIPRIQSTLQDLWGHELGKNINADEAAAMGAVYRAADLGQGFKVKKFHVKEAVLFPIEVGGRGVGGWRRRMGIR